MTKRMLAVILFGSMLALGKPAPVAAHSNVSVAIGLPFFGVAIGVPGGYYGAPIYAAPPYAAPAYVPGPVYGPGVVYGAGVVYGPRRGYYGGYGGRPYYGPRAVARRYRHW